MLHILLAPQQCSVPLCAPLLALSQCKTRVTIKKPQGKAGGNQNSAVFPQSVECWKEIQKRPGSTDPTAVSLRSQGPVCCPWPRRAEWQPTLQLADTAAAQPCAARQSPASGRQLHLSSALLLPGKAADAFGTVPFRLAEQRSKVKHRREAQLRTSAWAAVPLALCFPRGQKAQCPHLHQRASNALIMQDKLKRTICTLLINQPICR